MNKLILLIFCCLINLNFSQPNLEQRKTKLQITVLNNLGNLEEGVKVQLFKSQEDYDASKNVVVEKNTDVKGKVSFDELDPGKYFVNAEKGDLNNFGAGISTGMLEAGKHNRITLVIE